MARTPIFIEVKDSAGNVVPAASVNIKRRANGADATIYNAEVAGSVVANPQIADSLGRVSCWVDRGDYNAFVTGTGISAYTVPIDAGPTGDAEIDINWLPSSVQSLVSGGNTYTVQTGGTLPVSPINGDEVIYTADATNGVTWHFKYRSASASTYKWELIGGIGLSSEVMSAGDEATASATYVALTTAGPSLTLPLAGDYLIEIQFTAYNTVVSGVSFMSYDIGATAALDVDAAGVNQAVASTDVHRAAKTRRKTITAAATTLTSKYRTTAGTANFRGANAGGGRIMIATPIRVA